MKIFLTIILLLIPPILVISFVKYVSACYFGNITGRLAKFVAKISDEPEFFWVCVAIVPITIAPCLALYLLIWL